MGTCVPLRKALHKPSSAPGIRKGEQTRTFSYLEGNLTARYDPRNPCTTAHHQAPLPVPAVACQRPPQLSSREAVSDSKARRRRMGLAQCWPPSIARAVRTATDPPAPLANLRRPPCWAPWRARDRDREFVFFGRDDALRRPRGARVRAFAAAAVSATQPWSFILLTLPGREAAEGTQVLAADDDNVEAEVLAAARVSLGAVVARRFAPPSSCARVKLRGAHESATRRTGTRSVPLPRSGRRSRGARPGTSRTWDGRWISRVWDSRTRDTRSILGHAIDLWRLGLPSAAPRLTARAIHAPGLLRWTCAMRGSLFF